MIAFKCHKNRAKLTCFICRSCFSLMEWAIIALRMLGCSLKLQKVFLKEKLYNFLEREIIQKLSGNIRTKCVFSSR